PLFPRLAKAIEHRLYGADLRAVLGVVLRAVVPPPVPAAARIIEPPPARDDLRIEHDDAVRVGPAVVSGLPHELVLQPFPALPAAMEDDVHAAALGFAVLRNVYVAFVVHADGVSAEARLVEALQPPARARQWRRERSEQVLEDRTGG